MNMIWLCITAVLSLTSLISGQDIDTSHIRVFPAANQSIAGVFQVSSLDARGQPQYAFNASEARMLCLTLGVSIATKAQVLDALGRNLETCRFGWIDEHLAVIPRINSLANCGQGQTGLVTWRAPVTKTFDVFCFNETDAETQFKDTTTISPVNNTDSTGQTASTEAAEDSPSPSSLQPSSSSSSPSPSPPSSPTKTPDPEAEAVRYTGSTNGSSGGKAVLITSACALLLTAVIVIVHFKLKRVCTQGFDEEKQQEESIETEDWTCDKSGKQKQDSVQEDEETEVHDSESDETH